MAEKKSSRLKVFWRVWEVLDSASALVKFLVAVIPVGFATMTGLAARTSELITGITPEHPWILPIALAFGALGLGLFVTFWGLYLVRNVSLAWLRGRRSWPTSHKQPLAETSEPERGSIVVGQELQELDSEELNSPRKIRPTDGEALVDSLLSSLTMNLDFNQEETWKLKYQRRYLKEVLGAGGAQAILEDCYGDWEHAEKKIRGNMEMWVLKTASKDTKEQRGGPD